MVRRELFGPVCNVAIVIRKLTVGTGSTLVRSISSGGALFLRTPVEIIRGCSLAHASGVGAVLRPDTNSG